MEMACGGITCWDTGHVSVNDKAKEVACKVIYVVLVAVTFQLLKNFTG